MTRISQTHQNNGIKLDKTYSSRAGWYELSYPSAYSIDEDEACTTFYDPINNMGVLQISAYQAPSPQSPRDLLIEYLTDSSLIMDQGNLEDMEDSHKRSVSYNYIDEEQHHRTWMITSRNYVMFITYICDIRKKDKGLSIVKAIVDSIKFEEGEKS